MIDIEIVKKEILEMARSISDLDLDIDSKDDFLVTKFPPLLPLKLNSFINLGNTNSQNQTAKYVSYKKIAKLYDREFVRQAYISLLKHLPDPQGEHMYTNKLRNGMSKAEILVRIRYSSEGRIHGIRIKGIFIPSFMAFLLKIPILNYFVQLFLSLATLSRTLKNIETDYAILKDHIIENEKQIELKINDSILRLNELTHWKNNSK